MSSVVQNRLLTTRYESKTRLFKVGVFKVSSSCCSAKRPVKDNQLHCQDLHTSSGAKRRLPALSVETCSAESTQRPDQERQSKKCSAFSAHQKVRCQDSNSRPKCVYSGLCQHNKVV